MLVQLLSVPICEQCTATVEGLMRLKDNYPDLQFEQIDMTEHPQLAEHYGLLSFEYDLLTTHAVAIDGSLAGVGHPSEQMLRSWLDHASSTSST